MRTRKAREEDVAGIARLVDEYARQGWLLPRSAEEIRAGLGRFVVLRHGERILGCFALEKYGAELAEIRSVAVAPDERGHGLGGRLLRAAMQEAKRRGYARVFAVTHAPEFFVRHGFQPISRRALRKKVERDCFGCPRRPSCRLIGVVAQVADRPAVLPVLRQEEMPAMAAGAAGNLP